MTRRQTILTACIALALLALGSALAVPHFKRVAGIRDLKQVLAENTAYSRVQLMKMTKSDDYKPSPDPEIERAAKYWKWALNGEVDTMDDLVFLMTMIHDRNLEPFISIEVRVKPEGKDHS